MVGCRVLRQLAWCLFASALVTQVAVFSTTIFLHRSATHKALELHPVGGVRLPSLHVDYNRNLHARVGGRASQASRVHRDRRRSAQPAPERLLVGAARQRVPLPQGSQEPGDARAVRERHRRGCLRSRGVPVRFRGAVTWNRGALLRAGTLVGITGGGGSPVHVRVRAVLVDQRSVPLHRVQKLRQYRHEHQMGRAAHRRGRASQQPSRASTQPEVQFSTPAKSIRRGRSSGCSSRCVSRNRTKPSTKFTVRKTRTEDQEARRILVKKKLLLAY